MSPRIPWDEYAKLTRERSDPPRPPAPEVFERSLGAQLCEFVARHWILAILALLSVLAGIAAVIEISSR
jgi:hypothetical protein